MTKLHLFDISHHMWSNYLCEFSHLITTTCLHIYNESILIYLLLSVKLLKSNGHDSQYSIFWDISHLFIIYCLNYSIIFVYKIKKYSIANNWRISKEMWLFKKNNFTWGWNHFIRIIHLIFCTFCFAWWVYL